MCIKEAVKIDSMHVQFEEDDFHSALWLQLRATDKISQ